MNKLELVAEIASISGLTKVDSDKALNAFLKTVEETLKKGDEVRLVGFGNFSTSKRKEVMGKNPRTGEALKIPASIQPKFKAGKALKDAINNK
jgi:DNA-binding protein HU-beta